MVIKKTTKNQIEKGKKKYVRFCPKCSSIEINQDKSTMQSLGYLPTKYICSNCGYSSFNFPEMNLNKLDKLHIKTHQERNQSELLDTSYGKFYVRIMWKIAGPVSLIFGLIFIYLTINSYPYDGLDLLMGIAIAAMGAIMCFITFTNKDTKQN